MLICAQETEPKRRLHYDPAFGLLLEPLVVREGQESKEPSQTAVKASQMMAISGAWVYLND